MPVPGGNGLLNQSLGGWLVAGRVKPTIGSVFAMDDALAALARMEAAVQFGKIVLTIP